MKDAIYGRLGILAAFVRVERTTNSGELLSLPAFVLFLKK